MTAILTPKTFGGNNISDGTQYRARFTADSPIGQSYAAKPNTIQVAGGFPKTPTVDYEGRSIPVLIELRTNTKTNREQLYKWFDPAKGELTLVATDESAVDRRITARCLQLVPYGASARSFIAVLWADNPIWEADSASTDTHAAVSGNSHDLSHTNNGATNSYPKITIRPRAVKNSTSSPIYCWFRNFATACAYPLTDPNGDGWPLMVMDSWDTAALVTAGKAQADGDDCRVYVDGVEVKRWFGTGATAWNQATTKVWINVPFPSRRSLAQTKLAMTATVPANGGTIEATEADAFATWAPSGYLKTGNTAAEVIWYGSRTNTVLSGIKRAQKTTAAAIHNAGVYLFRLPHDIRLTYGASALADPPVSANDKPIFDLALSTNVLRAWPTYYYAPGTRRTGQWIPANKPLNALSPLLRLYEDSGKMLVEDSPPAAGMDQGDLWYFPAPTGVTAFTHDVAVPSNMLLNVYGSDGVSDKLLASYNPDTDGDDKTVTPAASVDGVRYEAMLRTITGAEPTITYDHPLGTSANEAAQYFTLDQPCVIYGFTFKFKKTAGADGNVLLCLDKGGAESAPDVGTLIIYDLVVAAAADIGTSYTEHTVFLAAPLSLPAGSDYRFLLKRSASANAIYWGEGSKTYPKGNAYQETAGVWAELPGWSYWFRIFGDGSVCQPEVPTGSGNEVTIDNPRLTLSNVWGTIPAGVETACCLTDATITNTTTGKVLAVKLPTLIDESLVIDCKEKTAILTGNGESVAYAVTWPEGGEFYLAPGANVITYAEPGMTNTDLTLEVRDTWP